MVKQTHLDVAAAVDTRIKPQATSMIAIASSVDEVVDIEVTKPPVTLQEHLELIVRMVIPHESGKEACTSLKFARLLLSGTGPLQRQLPSQLRDGCCPSTRGK